MKRLTLLCCIVSTATLLFTSVTAATPEHSELQATTQQSQRYVVLNASRLRLRFEPNLNCGWLHGSNGKPKFLSKGTRLPYAGESGDFYRVLYNNQHLYVAKQYAYTEYYGASTHSNSRSSTHKSSQKYFAVINGTHVRLRTGPGTQYAYFTWTDGSPLYLPKGTYLEYVSDAGEFYKCRYQGRIVYLSKQYSYITR
ncbi:MAG: hypothetical protein J1F25_08295 [Prevotellaceae bacterium]|nr:hypothetical protein [Prevotellaceae bacterium]